MTARTNAADRARRAMHTALGELVGDLRDRRLALGLSQAAVGSAAGVRRSMLGRFERGEVATPDMEDLAAVAAVLGLAVRINAYPLGQPIADRVQLRLLAALRARLPADLAWRTEVPLPIAGDLRAWDAVVMPPDGWTAIEGISRLGAVDATVRRVKQKQRDDARIVRVVLAVLDTNRNREALAAADAVIRGDFPLDTRAVLAALRLGRAPAANGVVLLRVPADPGHPHDVHSGGKTVDADGGRAPKFVDKPVGRRAQGP